MDIKTPDATLQLRNNVKNVCTMMVVAFGLLVIIFYAYVFNVQLSGL